MIRVGSGPDGPVRTEAGKKVSGRGAYVCPSEKCIAEAKRRGSLSRTLREGVPDGFFDELMREVKDREKQQVGQHSSP
jgi:hypothetical protein